MELGRLSPRHPGWGKRPFPCPAAARWLCRTRVKTRSECHLSDALVRLLDLFLLSYKAFQWSSNIVTLKMSNHFQEKKWPNGYTSGSILGVFLVGWFVVFCLVLFGFFSYYLLIIKNTWNSFYVSYHKPSRANQEQIYSYKWGLSSPFSTTLELGHIFYKNRLVLGEIGWKHRNLYTTLNQVYLVHCLVSDHDHRKLFYESGQKSLN